jgi:parallel beta-helix repeat protein
MRENVENLGKKVLLATAAVLLMACIFALAASAPSSSAEHSTIVVPDDYTTIQQAIDNAGLGDTIYVKSGTYFENIVVNKPISLVGEAAYDTIVDGSQAGTVIEVVTDNVSISNLTVRNAGSSVPDAGIKLSSVENCSVSNNLVVDSGYDGIMVYQSVGNSIIANSVQVTGDAGILFYSSNNNTVSQNAVEKTSGYGIALQSSYYCQVTGNVVTDSGYEGIALLASNWNSVFRNTVKRSASHGIRLDDPSDYNTFAENTVTDNKGYGFWMWYSSHNLFYHNLCNNTLNVQVLSAPQYGYNSTNTWDNGYPSGGNYWSNYKGQDIYSGPYQNETGSDGIGDTPYVIDKYNEDRYPLMIPYVPEYPATPILPLALVLTMILLVVGRRKLKNHRHDNWAAVAGLADS